MTPSGGVRPAKRSGRVGEGRDGPCGYGSVHVRLLRLGTLQKNQPSNSGSYCSAVRKLLARLVARLVRNVLSRSRMWYEVCKTFVTRLVSRLQDTGRILKSISLPLARVS